MIENRQAVGPPNFLGCCVGTVLLCLSFGPSLLPRGWVLQGLLGGFLFAMGYALGRLFDLVLGGLPQDLARKRLAYGLMGLVYSIALMMGYGWQKEVRSLISLPPDPSYSLLGTTLLVALTGSVLLLVGVLVRNLFVWLSARLGRRLPPALSRVLALGLTVYLVVGLVDGFMVQKVAAAVNSAFSAKNSTTGEGIVQPQSIELSGSPASLIPWATLGVKGREFIGNAPTREELQRFQGRPSKPPIRVYVGLESAPSEAERAELAVRELQRSGGFGRSVLVVVTTTGTGWVDERGVKPLEFMYDGDTAIVAMQYSYLPSWASFLVDESKARAAGRELFGAVHAAWSELPEERRPRLLSFGESLGSFGAEAAFPTPTTFRSTSQGALLVGPPNTNPIWSTVVKQRDPGSPLVLPVVKGGRTVRFAARPEDLTGPSSEWVEPRAVYLQHPSDPIVWWSPELIYRKPDWLREPRGFDVSPRMRWFPLVTFCQVTVDFMVTKGLPAGHGHRYGTLPVDAWAQIAPPPHWDQAKTQRLKALIADLHPN